MTVDGSSQHLQRLLDLGHHLSLSVEVGQFLQMLLSTAIELTGSEIASVLALDETGTQLHFLALPLSHGEALKTIRVPVDASLAGWVCCNRESLNVTDVPADPRHFKGADQACGFVTRSLLAVPIIYRGETLAVLEAVNKTDGTHYTESDTKVLELLASQAAIAIQNTRLMDRVRRSTEEMERLERMKADFIAIASHELRTPLGIILGHATFLRETIDPEHAAQLEVVVRNAMRLKEIVDSMADMDNIQRGMASLRQRPISIRQVIDEVLDPFQAEAAGKSVALRVEIAGEDILVEGDAAKLAIAISNLVKNALTFTDPGGHILIAAEQIPGSVKLSVTDDGIGIPGRDLTHIFERFYQVESHLTRRHGGMGLGLSVAKVMVELHGGRIWAESVEGKGSKFTFIIPKEESPAGAEDRAAG